MKKNIKVIVAGVVVAVIGLVVLLCALGMSGWKFDRVNDWQEDTFNATATVERLNIKVNWGKVVVTRGETDKVSVKYEFDDRYAPKFEENNGKLTIETPQKRWYEFGFWFENAPRMEITVPQDVALSDIHLTLNAGTLQFGKGDWGKRIDVELNAGALSMDDVVTEQLYVVVNAGAFSVTKAQCELFSCNVSAGAFDAKELSCTTFDCEISAGSMNVKKLDSSQLIKLEVSAGSANLGLVGAKTDYNVSVSKSAGSCNVSSQTSASAPRAITVDISAGSVNVSFGK